MVTVIPYEHRGHLYRKIVVCNQSDAVNLARMFREESDVWLKKILAEKLREVEGAFSLKISEIDICEAIKCQIK